MDLLLVRHAEPRRIDSAESGGAPVDPELTARGRGQAARLGAWLAPERIDHIVTSPLRRALETAEAVAAAQGIDVEINPDLREYDADSSEYIPMEELRETKDERWQAMVDGRWEAYGGEQPDTFRARIVPCIDAIIDEHPGRRVLVSCHGGVINVYTASLLGLPHHLWFDPAYTSVTHVRAARGGVRSLASLNETGHLLGAREELP
jgi:2,3-bisphosphoglycerate-dependent phosphoglycerate mutase